MEGKLRTIKVLVKISKLQKGNTIYVSYKCNGREDTFLLSWYVTNLLSTSTNPRKGWLSDARDIGLRAFIRWLFWWLWCGGKIGRWGKRNILTFFFSTDCSADAVGSDLPLSSSSPANAGNRVIIIIIIMIITIITIIIVIIITIIIMIIVGSDLPLSSSSPANARVWQFSLPRANPQYVQTVGCRHKSRRFLPDPLVALELHSASSSSPSSPPGLPSSSVKQLNFMKTFLSFSQKSKLSSILIFLFGWLVHPSYQWLARQPRKMAKIIPESIKKKLSQFCPPHIWRCGVHIPSE